jgi:hypothetical protein
MSAFVFPQGKCLWKEVITEQVGVMDTCIWGVLGHHIKGKA